MKTLEYTVKDQQGIHARPAGLLFKVIKGRDCKVKAAKGDKEIDFKGVMAIMSLCVKKDDVVKFTFDGPEEDAVCSEVAAFLEENL